MGAERIRRINPYIQVEVVPEGITSDNVQRLVNGTDFIIDGVDVTTRNGWLAKMELHRQAAHLHVPVLAGYDLGSTQYTTFYDYGVTSAIPFDGKVDLNEEFTNPFSLLARLIPAGFVPEDLLRAVQSATDSEFSVPQLVDTAGLFGLITVRALINHLAGCKVAGEIALDLDHLVSTDAIAPAPTEAVSEWFQAAAV